MTRRRNARDVQVNRRHGALCRHERLKTYRLPHPCGELCGARPTESERRLKGERDHAAMLAAIACNICPRKAERERRRGLGACLGVVCRLACGVVRGWRMVHLKNAHNANSNVTPHCLTFPRRFPIFGGVACRIWFTSMKGREFTFFRP